MARLACAVLLALVCAASAAAPAACDPSKDCCHCCDPVANPTTCTKAKCDDQKKLFNPIGVGGRANPNCIAADHSIGTNQTFAWASLMLGIAGFLTILAMCRIDYTNDTLLFARYTSSGRSKRE